MRANLTLFFLVVFAASAWAAWDWPYIAKLMPVYVAAIPGLVLAVVQLYRDATASQPRGGKKGGGIEIDEVFEVRLDRKTETRRTLAFFAWFIGGALGIWLFGIVVALPLLVFLYALVEGRERWRVCVSLGLGVYALIWGLFEYLLEIKWPPGILFRP